PRAAAERRGRDRRRCRRGELDEGGDQREQRGERRDAPWGPEQSGKVHEASVVWMDCDDGMDQDASSLWPDGGVRRRAFSTPTTTGPAHRELGGSRGRPCQPPSTSRTTASRSGTRSFRTTAATW